MNPYVANRLARNLMSQSKNMKPASANIPKNKMPRFCIKLVDS